MPKSLAPACSAAELERNVKSDWSSSHCPHHRWFKEFVQSRAGLASTLVTVGCNKGYDFVASMRAFSNNATYSVPAVLGLHEKSINGTTHPVILYGACNAGRKPDDAVVADKVAPVRGFCIEPMPGNFQLLQQAFSKLGYLGPVVATHAAVGSRPGWAEFPTGTTGDETKGIDAVQGENKPDSVAVVTLDAYVAEHGIDTIDWLSIDTEGNDVRVIIGASQLFAAQKVRIFEFEAHSVRHWARSDLEDTVDLMDNFGYTCYWATNSGRLVVLSGCWSEVYRNHSWKNVMCALRTDPVFQSVKRIADSFL